MKTTARTCLFLFLVFFGFASRLHGQLRLLETENLRLVYFDGVHSYLAPHVARCFENSLRFHMQHWDYTLPEKVTVLLHDLQDYANGAAKNIPKDIIVVAIAPFSYTFETMPANERMNMIMNHELVHIYAMDRAAGIDMFYRRVFWGKSVPVADNPLSILYDYLCTPRRSAPRWYHEGIAVFLETWMAGGYGRALGAYDEMVFRTLVRDSGHFYDPVGLEAEGTKIDFHVAVNSYLYGTRFFSYLAYKYGPESLTQWVSRTDSSAPYFISQFKKVYGVSLDNEWSQWITGEREFQQENLALIRQYPLTPYRDITRDALGSISRAFYDHTSGKLFVAVNYPGRLAHLAAIDVNTGFIDRLCDVKGPALFFVSSLAFDPSTHSLFYTTDNYGWRDLRIINTITHQSQTLLKDVRIGDLAFNHADRSIWGVRHFNGISTLVRIPRPYDEWNTIYIWPYGKDIYDIDISPDGKRLSMALAEVSGRQTLIMMDVDDLMAGDTTYSTLHDFGNSNPGCFVFSSDGGYLYGSSYYTGASNIFRYDIEADSMDAMSNCETGFFRPIPNSADSLIVFRYTAKGFVPAVIPSRPLADVSAIRYFGQGIVEKHPMVKDWMVGSPGEFNLDSLTIMSGRYRAWQNVRPVSAYPVVEGYGNYAAIGIRIDFSDLLALHNSDLTTSYTPNNNLRAEERWHVGWNYGYNNWSLSFKHNGADFYDLFGPTKTSRKGYSLSLQYDQNLIFDAPRTMDWMIGVSGYGGLERLPEYQNVAASFDKFLTMSTELNYENLRASLGAVDYEKGYSWKLMADASYVNGTLYPHILSTAGYVVPLPLRHSSIWLRTAAGYAKGDRDEPFANFYFGGFGNNWVDHLPEKRYREHYSFPGVELNEIGGTNYSKLGIEWTLPPMRFRRLGFPALYCSWVRMAVFTTGLITNLDNRVERRSAFEFGSQVDFRLQLLSHLRLTFSVGYAMAWEEDRQGSREFMVSLKVL